MPAAMMPSSMPKMKMLRHVQMNVQRAAQKRECGIGKSHDETDQIKNFPVHGFTSLNLAPLVAPLDIAPLNVAPLDVATLNLVPLNLVPLNLATLGVILIT
jgi:hypothetical protein